ncbi:DUF2480 family protein [candidate division KSB1 bacterium]|nr:DUF2480 family protein [candidate division KSB1 bacterium]
MQRVGSVPKTQTIDIAEFFDGGIIREKSFREKVDGFDWISYQDKKVVIKGCDKVPVPTWAYLSLVAHLAPYASRIFWGEPCSAVLVYKKNSK